MNRLTILARPTRLTLVTITALLCLASANCSGFRKVLPGGPKMTDATFACVKTAESRNLVDLLSQSGAAQIQSGTSDLALLTLMTLLKGSDVANKLGVLMPCTVQGSIDPRWILCTDEYTQKCSQIPVMSLCHFDGQPLGLGLLWKPSRLTADGFND